VAEEAAWNFINTEKPKFDLVVINPFLVIGPEHNPETVNTSNKIFLDLMSGGYPGIFSLGWGMVDVRDVAQAHINAMTTPSAKGRYILWNETKLMSDIVERLTEKYPNYSLPTLHLDCSKGDALLRFSSYFQPKGVGQYLRTNVGRVPQLDNSKAKKDLGIEFTDMWKSIFDTLEDLIAKGHLPDLREKTTPEDKEYLTTIANKMKDPNTGVSVKDRTYHLHHYKNVFVGKEAVAWLQQNVNLKHRVSAVKLGQELMKHGVFHPATSVHHEFADKKYIYSFV